MWERAASLSPMIAEGWGRTVPASNLEDVCSKLNNMQQVLKGWADRDFGSVIKQTAVIRSKLCALWSGPRSVERQQNIKKYSKELDELLLREELMWRQRARAMYLREGDRNTKWFQRKATWRKKKNDITELKDSTGVWKENREEIKVMARQFFQSLYEKEAEVRPHEILQLVEKRVTEDMNKELTKNFTTEEISDALFQIGPLKALGPDGFPARFFQRNWSTL